jgi:hypothetical protein
MALVNMYLGEEMRIGDGRNWEKEKKKNRSI